MLWRCMNSLGVIQVCKIEKSMDASLHTELLTDNLPGIIEHFSWTRKDVIFQQDNNAKHNSNWAKKEFGGNIWVQILDWRAQSPDINPIENLWHRLKRRLQTYPDAPSSIKELW